jgi:poly-gamma-glutamate synthase PgsB/CapB
VCKYFDVDERKALAAMYDAKPDPGVLQRHKIVFGKKQVTIVNAMAANDPESTLLIWQMTDKEYPQINILINCRNDRVDRTFQMADLIKDRIKGDHYILTGTGTDILARKVHSAIESRKTLDLGGKKPDDVVNAVADFVTDNSLIFAMGNTVGFGEEMMQQFLRRKG